MLTAILHRVAVSGRLAVSVERATLKLDRHTLVVVATPGRLEAWMVARHLNEAAPGNGLVPATESNLVGRGDVYSPQPTG